MFLLVNDEVETAKITNWFDQFGDDCEPEEGVVCVIESSLGWLTLDVRTLMSQTAH